MPKIIGASLAEHRRKTRTALFTALSSLMRERSLDEITMSEIATTAGVGRTAIYNHFEDKEDLLVAFLEEELERYTDAVSDQLAATENPLIQLRIFIRAKILVDRPYLNTSGQAIRELISADNGQRLAPFADQSEEALKDILDRIMQAGMVPQRDTAVLASIVGSALGPRPLPMDAAARETYVLETEKFIFRGIEYPETIPLDSPELALPSLFFRAR